MLQQRSLIVPEINDPGLTRLVHFLKSAIADSGHTHANGNINVSSFLRAYNPSDSLMPSNTFRGLFNGRYTPDTDTLAGVADVVNAAFASMENPPADNVSASSLTALISGEGEEISVDPIAYTKEAVLEAFSNLPVEAQVEVAPALMRKISDALELTDAAGIDRIRYAINRAVKKSGVGLYAFVEQNKPPKHEIPISTWEELRRGQVPSEKLKTPQINYLKGLLWRCVPKITLSDEDFAELKAKSSKK